MKSLVWKWDFTKSYSNLLLYYWLICMIFVLMVADKPIPYFLPSWLLISIWKTEFQKNEEQLCCIYCNRFGILHRFSKLWNQKRTPLKDLSLLKWYLLSQSITLVGLCMPPAPPQVLVLVLHWALVPQGKEEAGSKDCNNESSAIQWPSWS
jgi:hypothetical protein